MFLDRDRFFNIYICKFDEFPNWNRVGWGRNQKSTQRRRNVTQAQKTRNIEKLFVVAGNFNFQLLKVGESFYTYMHTHSSNMIHEKQIVT